MLQVLDADARSFRRPWLDVLVRVVIPIVAFAVAAVVLFGCAGKPTASVGIASSYQGLALVRLHVGQGVEDVEQAVSLSMDHCTRAHGAGTDGQAQCLADLGWTLEHIDAAEAALVQVGAAYDDAADGLDSLERAWSRALPIFEHARKTVERLRP